MCQIINNLNSIILILKDNYTDLHMLMLYLLTVSHNSHGPMYIWNVSPPHRGGPPRKPKFIIPLFPQKAKQSLGKENLTSDKILKDGGLAQYLHSTVRVDLYLLMDRWERGYCSVDFQGVYMTSWTTI